MVSRRVFLKHGGLALVSLGFAPSFLARTAEAAGGARRKVLIAVFQRGAVDGLNMVVPFGERRLLPRAADHRDRAARAAPSGAIDLDGFFGLHPRMAPLKPLWDARQLAIVHACGSPDTTRSHFDAQDYMESGTPGVKSTRDGWLNRYLQVARTRRSRDRDGEDTPFRAVALDPAAAAHAAGRGAGAGDAAASSEFGVRGGGRARRDGASFEAHVRRGGRPRAATAPAARRSTR